MASDRREKMVWAASAPGKVILFGEHAVVYGMTAVAASINLRTTVVASISGEDEREALASAMDPYYFPSLNGDEQEMEGGGGGGESRGITLELVEAGVKATWSIGEIADAMDWWGRMEGEGNVVQSDVAACTDDLLGILRRLVHIQLPPAALQDNPGLEMSGVVFLHLYLHIIGLRTGKVTVTSELPIGAGLGSSASFCVALSGALLAARGSIQTTGQNKSTSNEDGREVGEGREVVVEVDEEALGLVNRWAFEGEKIIHGKPSGVDNNICSRGGMLEFRKGKTPRKIDGGEAGKGLLSSSMLVINTGVARNTRALVAAVREQVVRHAPVMNGVFEAMNAISEEFLNMIEGERKDGDGGDGGDGGDVGKEEEGMEKAANEQQSIPPTSVGKDVREALQFLRLQELVDMNQKLLEFLKVSHPSIGKVCQTTEKFELSSKLTGAGGGGCVLTWLPPNISPERLGGVKAALLGDGFGCIETVSGGEGLRLWRCIT